MLETLVTIFFIPIAIILGIVVAILTLLLIGALLDAFLGI